MNINIKQSEMVNIAAYHLPRFTEIPTVGLYLNQVAKYMNDYLEPFGDMEITESMISNYVKKHLITNPVKKQYDREQIAYLIFIAFAKSVLSMTQIQMLFDVQKEMYDSADAYDYFCSEFEDALQYVFGVKDTMRELETDGSDEKYLLRNIIITVVQKIYLNQFFKN